MCFTHFQDTPSFKGYVSILCTFRILFYWIITLDLTTFRIIFHWIVTLVSCATSGFFFNRYLRWYLGNLKDFLSEIVTVESRAFSASPSFQSYAIVLRSFRVFLDWIAILRYLAHFKIKHIIFILFGRVCDPIGFLIIVPRFLSISYQHRFKKLFTFFSNI